MATRTWNGVVSGVWDTAGNWAGATVPVNGDDVVLDPTADSALTDGPVGVVSLNNFTDSAARMQMTTNHGGEIQVAGTATLSGSIIAADGPVFAFNGPVALSGSEVILAGGVAVSTISITIASGTVLTLGTPNAILNGATITLGSGSTINGAEVSGGGGGITGDDIAAIASASATAVVAKTEFTTMSARVLKALPNAFPSAAGGMGVVDGTGYVPGAVALYKQGQAPNDFISVADIVMGIMGISYAVTPGSSYDVLSVNSDVVGTSALTFHCTPSGGPYTNIVKV